MGNTHVKFGCVSAPLDNGEVGHYVSRTSTRKLAASGYHDAHDLSVTASSSSTSSHSSPSTSTSSTPVPPIYEHGHFEHIHEHEHEHHHEHDAHLHHEQEHESVSAFPSFSGAESLTHSAREDAQHPPRGNKAKQTVKLLFLDVDGVLNNASTSWDEYHNGLDDQLLKYLKYIVEHTGCKIVLSTTWRLNANAKRILLHTLKTRADINSDDVVIGQTLSLKANGLHRTHEIYHYLKYNEWRYNVVSWCALDDLALNKFDALSKQIMSGHFVRTNAKIGLSPHNALSCIAILNQFDDEYNPYDYRR